MARSTCEVCCNPTELSRGIDSYRSSVLITLCEILNAVSGGGGVGENVNIAGVNNIPMSVDNGTSDAGTIRVTIASDSTGQVRLAAGVAIIGSLVANQSVNQTQINGVAVSVNNGTTDAGTQRVTISSDSTGQVTLATGANIIGSLTANQSVNVNQIAGTTTSVNNGTTDAGTQRVTISSDSTGQIKLAAGVAIIGSLVANQSVNVNQIAGTTTSVNNGTTDAGTQRVTLSSDSTGQVKLATGANTIGSLTANQSVNQTQINGVAVSVGNGTTDTGTQRVTISSDSTGTVIATQATAANLNAQVVGNVAHDAVDSGNPIKVGNKAIAFGTNPTAVAAADRTDAYANRAGIPFVLGGHPNIITIEAAYTTAQTDVAIVTVAGGLKIVVTAIDFVCDNANTVNVAVRVGFGAATTPTTTGVVLTHPGIAPGSGVVRGNGGAVLGVGADGEDLRITATVPTTGSMRVLVSYHTIES